MGTVNHPGEGTPREPNAVPYPPGWVSSLILRIKRLPVPPWLFYAFLLGTIELAIYASRWIEGAAAIGRFGPFYPYGLIGIYGVGNLAAIHYVDEMAGNSFEEFLPALARSESEKDGLRYELLTMPRRGTWLVALVGFVLGLLIVFLSDLAPALVQNSISFTVLTMAACFGFVLTAELLYHTVHQLRVVSHIHSVASNIDFLNPSPLYAFSKLSSLTGLIFLVTLWIDLALNPETLTHVGLMALNSGLVLIALASFLLPLVGMHRRLAKEKKRLQWEINQRIKNSMKQLLAQIDAAEFGMADPINKTISGLLSIQDFIAKTPTWPWSAQTLAFFVSALILPLVVYVIENILSNVLRFN